MTLSDTITAAALVTLAIFLGRWLRPEEEPPTQLETLRKLLSKGRRDAR